MILRYLFFFLIVLPIHSCTNSIKETPKAVLVVHGGAGWISKGSFSDSMEKAYKKAIETSLLKGQKIIQNGDSSVNAVQIAIEHLEDSPLFNAGKGSVFTHNETNEMDSAIMDGSTNRAGAVTGIKSIKNPIQAARAVMDSSVHVFLSGKGAEEFAIEQGLKQVEASYFFTQKNLLKF